MNYIQDVARAVFQDGGVELLTKYLKDCSKGIDELSGIHLEDKASNLAIDFTNENKYRDMLYNSIERKPINHGGTTMEESLNVRKEDFKGNLYKAVQKFMQRDSAKMSEIVEELEKNLSPREISIVAAREVIEMIKKLHNDPLRMLLEALGGESDEI